MARVLMSISGWKSRPIYGVGRAFSVPLLRPERDYPVSRSKLPEGYATIDTVRLELAEPKP
jgi:hypothetical protein